MKKKKNKPMTVFTVSKEKFKVISMVSKLTKDQVKKVYNYICVLLCQND